MKTAERLAAILAANGFVLSDNTRALSFDEGKYVVVMSYDQPLRCVALRHGEPWRDLIGDNLIAAMFACICDLQAAPPLPPAPSPTGFKAFTGQRPWSNGGLAAGAMDVVMASQGSGKSMLGDSDGS